MSASNIGSLTSELPLASYSINIFTKKVFTPSLKGTAFHYFTMQNLHCYRCWENLREFLFSQDSTSLECSLISSDIGTESRQSDTELTTGYLSKPLVMAPSYKVQSWNIDEITDMTTQIKL